MLPGRFKTRHATVMRKIASACLHPDVSDPFLLMNDDFFIMHPLDAVPILTWGTLDGLAGRYSSSSPYRGCIANAARHLRDLGLPVRNFELHAPLLVHKEAFLAAVGTIQSERCMVYRSVYGNHAGLTSEESAADFKVYSLGDLERLAEAPFLSSDPAAFRLPALQALLRERFPAPGAYEAPSRSSRFGIASIASGG
jgi:hypothetical protein